MNSLMLLNLTPVQLKEMMFMKKRVGEDNFNGILHGLALISDNSLWGFIFPASQPTLK